MNRLRHLFFTMTLIGSLFIANSCDDDDDPVPLDRPAVTASTPSVSVTTGEAGTVSFSVNVPGGFASASADEGTVDASGIAVGATSGTISVTLTPASAGTTTITLTVTDQQSPAKTGTAAAAIVATDPVVGAPMFSGIPPTATITEGDTLKVPNVVLTADEGLSTLAVAVDGTEIINLDISAETSPYTIPEFAAPQTATLAPGEYTIVFTLTDGDGETATFTHTLTIAADVKPIVDVFASAEGVGDVTWTKDNIYVLRGFIFVNDGQTLTIEEGTVIKGQPGQGAGASALIVARGGTILAEGTADEPIIMTGLADDLAGSVPDDQAGLWGGLIVLGNAPNNNASGSGELAIEGIPIEDVRGLHGGTTDMDNSGILRYVSVRHGGSIIGADNEINGITFGSVGSGTIVENVEVFANLDDGIELFGGDVNLSNVVVAYAGDDGLDIDDGYSGSIQNGIVWSTSATQDSDDPRGAEWDGATGSDEANAPFAEPKIANITFFYDDDAANNLSDAIYFRDNFAGSLYNSIVFGHDAPIDIERRTDRPGTGGDGNAISGSSYDRFVDEIIRIEGNVFFNVNGVSMAADAAGLADLFELSDEADATAESGVETYLFDNNTVTDPGFGTGADKFTPSNDLSAAATDLTGIGALQNTTYVGGVDPSGTPFFSNWSKIAEVIVK